MRVREGKRRSRGKKKHIGAGRRSMKRKLKRGQSQEKIKKHHETNGKTDFQKKRVVKNAFENLRNKVSSKLRMFYWIGQFYNL